jgi:hypothetical protein
MENVAIAITREQGRCRSCGPDREPRELSTGLRPRPEAPSHGPYLRSASPGITADKGGKYLKHEMVAPTAQRSAGWKRSRGRRTERVRCEYSAPQNGGPGPRRYNLGSMCGPEPEGLQSEAKLCPSVCRLSRRCCAQCDQDHDICERKRPRPRNLSGTAAGA